MKLNKRIIQLLVLPKSQTCPIVPSALSIFYGSSADFAEAFERFESVVDISRFKSYRELAYAFSHWAGRRWVDSYKQNEALRDEARKRGFFDAKIPDYFRRPPVTAKRTYRFETVKVRGKSQVRFRELKTGRFIKKPK